MYTVHKCLHQPIKIQGGVGHTQVVPIPRFPLVPWPSDLCSYLSVIAGKGEGGREVIQLVKWVTVIPGYGLGTSGYFRLRHV